MKAFSILLAGMVPTAFAMDSLVARQGQSVTSVIVNQLYMIGNATVDVNNIIMNFTPTDLIDLQTVSAGVVNDIYSANKTIAALDGMVDATDGPSLLSLVGAITNLATTVNATIGNLIDQKAALGGAVPVVKVSLQQQLNATNILNLTVVKKLPVSLVATSANATAPILNALNQGIEAFSTVVENPPSAFDSGASALFVGFLPVVVAALVGRCLF